MREAKIAVKVGDAAARVSGVESRDSTDYPWPAINLLDALVPSDAIAWFCMTKDTAELIGFPGERPDGEVAQQLVELSSDHPLMLSYQSEPTRIEPRAPRRLSDLVSDRQLRRTRTYSELLRPVDRIRQVTLMSTVDQRGTWISWTLNRRRMDFTDDELATLSQLRPTLSLLDSYAAPARHSRLVSAQVGEDLGLTRREVEVLECIRRGLTARAAARLLGVSPGTVSKHLEHSYRKLGCDNRVSALERLSEHTSAARSAVETAPAEDRVR